MKLGQLEPVIKRILTEYPNTRANDELLYSYIIESYGLSGVAVGDFFLKLRVVYGVPQLESVGRVRRKIQEENPELRATMARRVDKAAAEKDYKGYALKGGAL